MVKNNIYNYDKILIFYYKQKKNIGAKNMDILLLENDAKHGI